MHGLELVSEMGFVDIAIQVLGNVDHAIYTACLREEEEDWRPEMKVVTVGQWWSGDRQIFPRSAI